MLLLVLGHVQADERLLIVEEKFRERASQLCLADPSRTEKDERADRSVRVGEARARPAHRIRDRAHRLVLPDDPLVQPVFHADELCHLTLHQLRDRDSGPAGDDLGNVLFADLLLEQRLTALQLREATVGLLKLLFDLDDLAVAQLRRLCELGRSFGLLGIVTNLLELSFQLSDPRDDLFLMVPARSQRGSFFGQLCKLLLDARQPLLRSLVGLLAQRLALDLELPDLPLELVQLRRQRVDLGAQSRGRLVDQVNGLVGKEPIRDVAVRQNRRGNDRRVLDADSVVHLVALAQPAQDADRVLDRRLVDQDRLEAPLQCSVLLDVLAVLVESGRADGPQLTAGERGLQQVGGVDRAFRRTGSDESVQLVDEQDHLSVGPLDLLQHGLQAVFELTAVFRTGDESVKIERDHSLALESLRHIALRDTLGKTFGNRRLAHPGLANEDGIVLGASRKNLDYASDLFIATDDGVELAVGRELGKVPTVFLERLVFRLGILVGDALIAADLAQRAQKGVVLCARFLQQLRVGQRQHEVLGGGVLVLEAFSFALGLVNHLIQ